MVDAKAPYRRWKYLYMGYWEDSDSDCDSDTMNADSD